MMMMMMVVVVVVVVDRGAKLSFFRSYVDSFVRLYYKYETLQQAQQAPDPLVDGKGIHPGVVLGGELLAGAKARGAHHLAAPAARDALAPVLHAASHARPARQVPWRTNESTSRRVNARRRDIDGYG